MNVTVIGLGLIGGSVLQALAAAGHRAVGFDVDPATRDLARAAGYRVSDSIPGAVADAELVVLAVPLPVLPSVLDELAGYDGLLTDVTSVKGPVRQLVDERRLRHFVGGHPMAGKETSGFAAADPRLFAGCAWVLCLEPDGTDLADWLTLAALVSALGARVMPVTAAEHDRAVAQVSHVPHLVAAALSRQLAGQPLAAALAAGSFRDGTRVAGTRAELTAAMCGGNAVAVHDALGRVIGDLEAMRDQLESGEPIAALLPALRLASQLRQGWPAPAGVPAELPAESAALLALGRAGGWITAVAPDHASVSAMRPETDRYRP